jgi:hypothetical protein
LIETAKLYNKYWKNLWAIYVKKKKLQIGPIKSRKKQISKKMSDD